MFDTTLGTALGFLVRMIWLIVSRILGRLIQHPLIATGLAIFVGIISQTDLVEKLKETYEKAIDWLHGNNIYKCHPSYDYSIVQGPHTWLEDVGYQSPVNIEESQIQRLAIRELLNWNHYDDLPASIQLENTGQTLVLRAQFHGNAPTISGADLLASYTFVEIRFRWGWCNSEGSEHTLNHRKFPLEMQVMHRAGSGQPRACTSSYDLLMIAYVFELSAHNPFLDPLIQNLRLVQQPGKRVCIPPFPLSYLMYAFRAGFYSYGGSLTQPPCYQGTEWFIFPESLAISDFQLRHFRQLLSTDGITPITRNSRPVQHLGNRVINLNCFCPYDANQLARMHVELCQQQQQKLEEEQQQQEQEEQEHRRQQQEQQQQQQQQQEQHQQQESEQQQHFVEKAPLATTEAVAFEDEGHLIETIDTTTIISSSNSSICMTTLMRKQAEEVHGQAIHTQHQEQPQNQNQNSCRIIFTGGSADTNNNTNKCGLQRDQSDDIEITGGGGEGTVGGLRSQSSCDALCGVGDGVNVGNVRVELIE